MQDDAKDLCSKGNFLKILDMEINRSRSQGTNLSLCFMKLNLENTGSGNPDIEQIISSLGKSFAREIRSWDTLSRYGRKTFALLLPQLSVDEAKRLCNRFQRLAEDHQTESGDNLVKITFGLAELALDTEENSSDLIERAIAFF
jgi:GGDEF domain-containing protein